MSVPERLTVPTCFGCGAMQVVGTCETGCSEQRLELVRADPYDAVRRLASAARTRADALARVAEELATCRPAEAELQTAYGSLRDKARDTLRRYPEAEGAEIDLARPAEPATTWWCAECGGIDAPQPCLGICVWRPVEWVDRALYENERERAILEREAERRLARLLNWLVFATPRPEQWERNWRALQAEARDALASRAAAHRHT